MSNYTSVDDIIHDCELALRKLLDQDVVDELFSLVENIRKELKVMTSYTPLDIFIIKKHGEDLYWRDVPSLRGFWSPECAQSFTSDQVIEQFRGMAHLGVIVSSVEIIRLSIPK